MEEEFGDRSYSFTPSVDWAVGPAGEESAPRDEGSVAAVPAEQDVVEPGEVPDALPEDARLRVPEPAQQESTRRMTIPGLTFDDPPAVAPAPAVSASPAVAPAPAVSASPAVAPAPAVSASPAVAPAPAVSASPAVAPAPAVSASPAVAPAPAVSASPAVAPAPAVSATPGYTPTAASSKPENVTIKNARVGQEYCESLGVQVTSKLLVEQPLIPHGLSLDLETFVLRGIPTTPGDFEWRVRGEFNGSLVDKVFRLAVIPDPKTLWKDIPSDPQAPFWKRDQQTTLLTGEVLMVGASKRGRSHAHEGRYRDDHFDMTSAGRGGWHVLAVADGAGSAKFSRQGSKIAVEFVIRTLPGRMMSDIDPHLDQILDLYENGVDNNRHAIRTLLYEVLVGVGFEAARAVESEAKHAGLEAGDFSTTLIMAAAKNTPSGWFFVSFSVGDGGAALLDLDAGEVVVMSTPDGGEFAGQTRFLRSSEFADPAKSMERIHFAIRPHFTSLVLMTDGITDPKFPTEVTMADFSQWSEFWGKDLTPAVNLARANAAEIEGELLNWLDFWSDGNHDDRTIAILIP